MQATPHLLMIRPVQFAFNAETAVNNAFQIRGDAERVQENALKEFDHFVEVLRSNGIDVLVVQDIPEPHTPDSLFPNNWVSFHDDGTMVLYPMFAPSRRAERKPGVLTAVEERFRIRHRIDLSAFEDQGKYLEGTGSLVLDRDKKVAYACLSPRTDAALVQRFCEEMHYHGVMFTATDERGSAIYHTNVMMCVADAYVVICLESIRHAGERDAVRLAISNSGKELIEISLAQMNAFAGNMLQVASVSGQKFLVMSSRAYHSLTAEQVTTLSSHNQILHAPLDTIETNGGGSARCMIAEVHLPVLY